VHEGRPTHRVTRSGSPPQDRLELRSNRIQVPGQRFGVTGSDQFLHAGPRRTHGVSQGPRASSTGVIRSGSLEGGQPILDGGDPARPDSPTTSDLVKGARLPQLGDEHAGEPGNLFLGSREVGQPCPALTSPHQKRNCHGDCECDGCK
jgi:hypothetical protein